MTEVGAKPVAVVAPSKRPPRSGRRTGGAQARLVVKAPEPARQDKGKRR